MYGLSPKNGPVFQLVPVGQDNCVSFLSLSRKYITKQISVLLREQIRVLLNLVVLRPTYSGIRETISDQPVGQVGIKAKGISSGLFIYIILSPGLLVPAA